MQVCKRVLMGSKNSSAEPGGSSSLSAEEPLDAGKSGQVRGPKLSCTLKTTRCRGGPCANMATTVYAPSWRSTVRAQASLRVSASPVTSVAKATSALPLPSDLKHISSNECWCGKFHSSCDNPGYEGPSSGNINGCLHKEEKRSRACDQGQQMREAGWQMHQAM